MYKKTADAHHYLPRTGSHSTKGSAAGLVPWAKDDYDLVTEWKQLRARRKFLGEQLQRMKPGRDHRKVTAAIKVITAELKAFPKLPPKPSDITPLLTDVCPENMNLHKFRRLQRRWAAT
jgi:hypothetical protein